MGSQAIAPQVVDVTLSLFGGRKTDIAPSDCPEGLSPDEQDNVYLPGDVQSRPGLARLFALGKLNSGLVDSGVTFPSVLYEKTYVQPNNQPITLILTSDGQLWAELVATGAGNPSVIGSVPAGLYAQSITAFGREYLAISDLINGAGVPLQYDGTNLDRVTQDGPGQSPTVVDYEASIPIQHLDLTAVFIIAPGPGGAVQTGNIVTITTTAPHGFAPNQSVFVQQVAVAGYNGLQIIGTVPSPTTFTYTLTATGLAASGNGFVGPATTLLTTAFTSFASPPQVDVGDNVIVTGTGGGLDNNVAGNPVNWQVVNVFWNGLNAWIISFSFATAPSTVSFSQTFVIGNLFLGGQSSPGVHQVVCMFLTRQGGLTAPSPPLRFVSTGNTQWLVTNLPLGPPNVVARVLGFTGAGGDNFFSIMASIRLPNPTGLSGAPVIVQSTIVPDNTSTSIVMDVADNTLFAATAIDQIGNDLFDQRVLGPVLGFFAYASRLMCWGDYQKVENFLNMGFCGGYLSGVSTTPLGWTNMAGSTGGILVNGGSWTSGMSWQITGDGTSAFKGGLQQSAYQDAFGNRILLPLTDYTVRLWAKKTAGGTSGQITVNLFSPSAGPLLGQSVQVSAIPAGGGFVSFELGTTPAVIPSDTILRLYDFATTAGTVILHGELELIYTQNPYNNTLVRTSYVNNPEGFAQTTGNLGAADDDSPVRALALLRKSTLLETADGVHIFQDNGQEPDQWVVDQLTRAVGALSLRSGDPGKFGTGDAAEDWALVASKNGVYLFAGAEFWKVSQEISRGALTQAQDPRPCWDDIYWPAQKTIVAKNDPASRRAYFAVPLNGSLTPNGIFVLDYREMDTATQIAAAPPVHITIQGKMKSSDLTRKWSFWNVAASDMEILVRPGNQRQLFFAGAAGPSGNSYANLYSLDPSKLTDDDYGPISPYYTTYAFVDHDQEQALQLGSQKHLYKKVSLYVAGVGLIEITPIINSLYNFQPQLSPRLLTSDTDASNALADDLEWTTEIHGQRVFFRISVQASPGATDVQYRVQKFITGIMRDPVAAFATSAV